MNYLVPYFPFSDFQNKQQKSKQLLSNNDETHALGLTFKSGD